MKTVLVTKCIKTFKTNNVKKKKVTTNKAVYKRTKNKINLKMTKYSF